MTNFGNRAPEGYRIIGGSSTVQQAIREAACCLSDRATPEAIYSYALQLLAQRRPTG